MNLLDAKNPKFDPAWWRTHKAGNADPRGALESALTKYLAAKNKMLHEAKTSNIPYVENVKLALGEVKREALAEKGSNRLGTFQKETLAALGNYAQKADAAQQEFSRLETAPIMKEGVKFLVKQAPQFQEYCNKNFQGESFNFLSLMYKGPIKEKQWYEAFIMPGGKFEVNIRAETIAQFKDVAKAVEAGAKPNIPATWAKAPWDLAVTEIEKMLQADVVPRFRRFMTGVMMTGKLP